MIRCRELVESLRQTKAGLEEMTPSMPAGWSSSPEAQRAYFGGWDRAIDELASVADDIGQEQATPRTWARLKARWPEAHPSIPDSEEGS